MMNNRLKDKLANLPTNSGVYLMKDVEEKILYVGKASSLNQRVRSYFQSSASPHALTEPMLRYVHDVDFVLTKTYVEALILENNLIKEHQPRYNVKLKDDKRYPYLKLTVKEPYAGLYITRQIENDGSKYFGPFVHTRATRLTVKQLTKAFPVRTCSLNLKESGNAYRVCLDYHINRCPGPCADLISTDDYAEIVNNVRRFLSGNTQHIIQELAEKMQNAAANLDFEGAAKYRDQIETVNQGVVKQHIDNTSAEDEDVIGIACKGDEACVQVLMVRDGKLIEREHYFLTDVQRESKRESLTAFVQQYYQDASFIPKTVVLPGEIETLETIQNWLSEKRESRVALHIPQKGRKRQLVEMASKNANLILEQKDQLVVLKAGDNPALVELQELLNLNRPPQRIDAFDISNLGDRFAVGSMVVMEDGEPAKSEYRRFKIRTVEGQNDFAMMKEVVTRRFRRAIEENRFPDLILIDGGKGQLSAACEALKSLELAHLPIIGLAKRFEHIFLPNRKDAIVLRRDNPTLHLIQRLRDEAHRFAISYHHKLRSRAINHSILDEIPNIGAKRKQRLLQHFGSVASVRQASLDELLAVKGIPRNVANSIRKHLSQREHETH
ncbi:MAG: excinuclease ABC subunit UvrC [Candidatus Poribacteria bacterium]|nr:excinuclease ABC subunit UvrC [Candidatus Poribacteria bacterium]